MGMFSGICKLCKEPVNDGEDSALVQIENYCGYGLNEGEPEHYWHKKCYSAVLGTSLIDMGVSDHDPDQGLRRANPKHQEG
jgi:hypothetical protein